MKTIYAFLIIAFCFINFRCIAVKLHDYAELNKNQAVISIQKLKVDTLVIVVPTYQKKELLLKTISKNNRKNRKLNKQKLLNLYAERELQQTALIQSFKEHYTFSSYLFIPDSLVYNFEAGINGFYFLNNNAQIDSTLSYSNPKPIKLVQQFDQEWQIKVGNRMVPNPFPNYYIYRNGLFGYLGQEPYEEMYDRVAEVFQKRFESFYSDPDRRIYL